ncbi:MAG: hypothetical protein ACPGU1_06620 [Myxococcota bacterium]
MTIIWVTAGCSGDDPGAVIGDTTTSGTGSDTTPLSDATGSDWQSDASLTPDVSAGVADAAVASCDSVGAVRCFGGLPQVCADGAWAYTEPCGDGQICVDGLCVTGCAPSCDGLECGDDGCGGSCGACAEGFSCDSGACAEAVCEPDCGGKVCGADGCAGLCGECAVGELCAPDGTVCVACGPAEMLDCDKNCVATVSYADGNCDAVLACADLLYDGGDCPEECPPGQIINCSGTCSLAAWKGNGTCDEQLNCESHGYDSGDCDIPCEVGLTQDCDGGCSPVESYGDGTCDAPFSCADMAYDGGDCEIICDEGMIQNCEATCTTETWLGDDFCDSKLNCEAFDWDNGDCCPANWTKGCDEETCAPENLKANGVCDDVFACSNENFDGGDCPVICDEDKIENCEFGCTTATWLGDNFCDSKLNCEALNFDDLDCEPCYPDCEGKNCGSDGCTGSCGVCTVGLICGEGQVCGEPGQGSDCSDPLIVGAVPWTGTGDTKLTTANFQTELDACPGMNKAYGAGSNDHVYAFTPEITGVYTVTVTGEFDSLTYVAEVCEDIGSTCLGAVDNVGIAVEEVVFPGVAGERVYLFVDGWSNGSNLAGPYTIDVSEPCFPVCDGKVCGPDSCGSTCGQCESGSSCTSDGAECVDNTLIQGNTCVNPFEFGSAPGTVTGDSTYASNDYNVPLEGGCEGTSSTLGKGSFEQVWRFELQSVGVYTVSLTAEYDSALYIVGDCDAMSETCFGAKDSTGTEIVTVSGQPGEVIYIIVDGYSSTVNMVGPYVLSISEPCVGSCEGKVCGGDGCGGNCGACGEGEGCDPTGQCLPFEELPGNTCDNPVSMKTAPLFVTGETTAASNDFSFDGGECPGTIGSRGGMSNDRVHEFTAQVPGVYTFGLDGDFDTTLYVLGDCADVSGTCKGAADKVNETEYVLVSLQADETVFVVVDGWSDYSNTNGEYTLSVSEPCTPSCDGKTCGDDGCGSTCGACQAGYACTEAQTCEADDLVPGNVCFNPLFIPSAPYVVTGTTEDFNANYSFTGTACPGEGYGMGAASSDVAYRFTAPFTATYTFRLAGEYDSLIYVVDDCFAVDDTCHGASDLYNGAEEVVVVSMVAGQTVFVIVDGFSNSSNFKGDYTLTVDEPCIPACAGKQCGPDGCGATCGECQGSDICDMDGLCLDAASIPGNICENPFTITAGETVSGDTTAASNAFSFVNDACVGAYAGKGGASRDLVYRFQAPADAVFEVTLSSDFDAAIYVIEQCDAADDTCLGGVDNAILGDEVLSFTATAGQDYFIVVDGWSNSTDLYGTYMMTLTEPCIQQCDGKVCGPDGCGQSCGECPGFDTCNNDGQCEACEPDCDDKACGDDGCGSVCGVCGVGEGCTDQGQCSSSASCTDSCGGAGEGCFCDEFCFDSGDCCDDICSVCLDDPAVAAKCGP